MAQLKAKGAETALVNVSDLTGGIDRRTAPTLLKPDRSRRNRNARLSVAGRWIPRPGWVQRSTTNLGHDRGQGGTRVYIDGVDPFLLYGFNGDVYRPTDAGVFGSAVLTGLDATNQFDFPSDAQIVAVFDGVNVPKKSEDGTTWTQMGITAPTVAPGLSATAGGSLTSGNTYEVAYTYRDTGLALSSNGGTSATQGVSGGNLTVHVTMTVSADPQVDMIDVYARDVTSGETVLRLAGSVANTGSPSLDLTTNNWSDAEEIPTTHDVPPPLSFGVIWKNRWWAKDPAGATTLRFSEIFQNQVWPTDYAVDIPFPTGDEIRAIVPLGDSLIVFGSNHPGFIIFGQTSLDFDVRPTAGIEAGCFGFRAWDFIESGVVHAAPEGVYVFDGASDRLLSFDFESDWRQMVETGPEADLQTMAVTYHAKDKELRVGVSLIPIYGTPGEWVLDLARTKIANIPAWSTTDRQIGGYILWDGPEILSGNRGRLWSWDLDDGILNEEATGTSANGSDMDAQYEGPAFTVPLKVSRFTHFYMEYRGAAGVFSVAFRVDGSVISTQTVNLGAGIAQYGTSLYGSA
ncbi:MAG TPA: hypothetical protein VNH18_32675, partial [Bryobacteraceae bacterium]|nr:hypothetical protein [Bryobacteraceae bacterium]